MEAANVESSGSVRGAGGEIHYEYLGRRERPPVVFFNALNQTVRSWHQYIGPIAEQADVLLWDYPGVGASPAWARTPTFEQLADGLHEITRALGLHGGPVRLLGICFGAGPALEFLRRYREQVDKVVLSGAMLTWEEAYASQRMIDRRLLAEGRIGEAAELFFAHFFSSGFQQAVGADPEHRAALIRKIAASANEMTDRLIGAQLDHLKEVERHHEELAELDVPVKLIAGEQDLVTPPYVQRKILGLLPNASYVEYPGAGHLLYVEEGLRFFTDALEFLSS